MFRVISKTHHSLTVDGNFDAKRAHRAGNAFIKDGIKEQQLVADYREHGLSLVETTMLLDKRCIRNNRETVRRSTVCTCEQNMTREVSNIEKRPQGKKDITSDWERCWFRWVTQILIRLGYHDGNPDDTKDGAVKLGELKEDGKLPDYFNLYEMTPINLHAIALWDVSIVVFIV